MIVGTIKFILRWIVLLLATAVLAMMSWLIAIFAIAYVVMVPCIILGEHFVRWLSDRNFMDRHNLKDEFADYGSTLLVPFKGMRNAIMWACYG